MPEFSERVQELLGQMSLEEKVGLLAGASMWLTVPVERLGVPAIKVTDGPNGARGAGPGLFAAGTRAACLPAGISLASSWNTELVGEVGQVLAEEAQSKAAVVLLGPTINIHRSPLNGRNFECYSEDPYLAGQLAVAYIKGLQSKGIGASVKHYAGNNSEFERNTISSEIGERALREIYLPAFEAAVKEGDAWTVMAAYNKVNGTYASENPMLLTEILKDEWGWEGVVVSDWFATHTTAEAVNAGLDLEMPGPTQWRGQQLVDAVKRGDVSEEAINKAASRMLHLIERAGALDHPEMAEEQATNLPAHRAVARRAAGEGVVLLTNDGTLPLDRDSLKSIAVIGPNAKTPAIMGGGSARVNAHYAVSPYDGVMNKVAEVVEVGYTIGTTNHKYVPPLPATLIKPEEGSTENGFMVRYYNSPDLSGEVVYEKVYATSELVWINDVGPGVDSRLFSARITGVYIPSESGAHVFSLTSSGLAKLYVDGEMIIDNWTSQERGDSFMGAGSAEKTAVVNVKANKPIDIMIEYSKQGAGVLAGARVGAMPVVPGDAIQKAAELAAKSDVAILYVGTNSEWESEGADKVDMELVGRQGELIEAVCAANPRTVVVLQTGSPIAMPWLSKPAAVLQAWFPGQECGNGIADVLFGEVDASGRLPQTFPMRLQDNPAYINYPGENGKVTYGEGIFVGYRYYEKKDVAPLFPFGYGLSYTTFEYANLRLSSDLIGPDDKLEVSVDVTNTGERAGSEVVQLYVSDQKSSLVRPNKELKRFAKVKLEPGATQTVTFTLDRRALAYWDDQIHRWVAEAGVFTVLVGRSSADIVLSAEFELKATAKFDGPGQKAEKFTLQSTVRSLMTSDAAMEAVERHLPGFFSNPQLGFAQGFSLGQLAGFDAQTFNEAVLGAIAEDLEKLS